MLVNANEYPDAKCIFNGDDISGICSSADEEEGWAEVLITIREEKIKNVTCITSVRSSDKENAELMKVKIYGTVEIDLEGDKK